MRFNLNNKNIITNIILSFQHTLAMFGATILIPILMGLSPSTGLLCAGVGTILYALCTKGEVPIFLGSSAIYLGAFLSIKTTMGINVAVGSFIGAGITFLLMALVVKFVGYKRISKLFPNTVAGSIIIVLGITLVPVSIMLMKDNYLLATISAVAMIVFALSKNKIINTIPVLLAIATGYIASIFMGLVDFTAVVNAPWFTVPQLIKPSFNLGAIGIMMLYGLVQMLEHIGDLTTNGMIVGRNHFEKTGLHKSFLGNGLALLFSGIVGGNGVTSYGENSGVLALTKVYNPRLIQGAGLIAIAISFLGKFNALLSTIPLSVIGGVSFILFGMLTMSGVSAIKETKVNLMDFRHSVVVFLPIFIGVASLLSDNPFKIVVNQYLTLSGLSLAAIVAIGLNLILVLLRKDNEDAE